MLQIIIILLVTYIVIPLVELIVNLRIKFALTVLVYVVTLVWVLYTLYPVHRLSV